MKLDCLLINPCKEKREENIWKHIDSCFPSLGIASIAGYVREQGFSVKMVDAPALKISLEKFEEYLKKEFRDIEPEFIGFTGSTSFIKNAYEMAETCHRLFPNAKIVFGGAHTTALPEEILSKPFVDIAVIGEGELTFFDILSKKELSDIKGICYRENGDIRRNLPQERINNLDKLPYPAYDLLPMDKYFPAKGTYKRLPAMSMLTARGCPGTCTFCNKVLGLKIKYRSAESLIKEIKYLIEKYGIKQIMFYDDTFTTFKDNVRKFCELVLAEKIDITWCCFSRVDYVDEELLKLMKKAGCHQIMYGIESGDEQILKNIKKRIDLDKVKKAVKWTKKAGIDCRGAFMIGNPGETSKTVKKTLKFAIDLDVDIAIFNITTPYPGTEMFGWAKQNALLLTFDWDEYDLSKPVMKLPDISADEIANYCRMCYKKFYFRPRYIIKRMLRLIRSPAEINVIFDGARSLVGFIKAKKS